jgi:hypothetical protein
VKNSYFSLAKVEEIVLGLKIFWIKTSEKRGYLQTFELGGV